MAFLTWIVLVAGAAIGSVVTWQIARLIYKPQIKRLERFIVDQDKMRTHGTQHPASA